MGDFNMPPGVSARDIPENEPERKRPMIPDLRVCVHYVALRPDGIAASGAVNKWLSDLPTFCLLQAASGLRGTVVFITRIGVI